MHLSGNEIDRDALPPDSYFLLQQRRLTSLALGAANNGRYCRKSQPITSRHELSDRNQIVFFWGAGVNHLFYYVDVNHIILCIHALIGS